MGKVIAILNYKGGVGKTTSSENLVFAIASRGKKALVVDLDPSAALTEDLGFDSEKLERQHKTLFYGLFNNVALESVIIKGKIFDIMPSSDALGRILDDPRLAHESLDVFKGAFRALREKYDYIVIDCPPLKNRLNVNALAASDALLMPVKTALKSVRQLRPLLRSVLSIRQQHNPRLLVLGILPTIYKKRNKHDNTNLDFIKDVGGQIGIQIFEPIQQKAKYEQAVDRNMPALQRYFKTLSDDPYYELADYIIKHVQ